MMRLHGYLVAAFTFIAAPGALSEARASTALSAHADDVRALDGEWLYVEDRTEGRASEERQPSMSTSVALRAEEDALVRVRSDGEIRMALDGSATDTARET